MTPERVSVPASIPRPPLPLMAPENSVEPAVITSPPPLPCSTVPAPASVLMNVKLALPEVSKVAPLATVTPLEFEMPAKFAKASVPATRKNGTSATPRFLSSVP